MPPAARTSVSTARPWNAHLVGEQSLLGTGDQVVEHVLHPAPAPEVQQADERELDAVTMAALAKTSGALRLCALGSG
jgi:hypothetical protein